MHSKAHNFTALGIGAFLGFVISFFVNFSFFNYALSVAFSGLIGLLADFDFVLKIRHRTKSHSVFLLLPISFVFTIIIYLITSSLQLYIGYNEFTGWDLNIHEFLIGSFTINIPTPDFTSNTIIQLGIIFFLLFVGGFSHIMLDVITVSSLPQVVGVEYEGRVQSDNAFANYVFIVLGIGLFAFGMLGYLYKMVEGFSFYTLIVSSIIFIIIIILIISLIKKKDKYVESETYCGNINGIDMCTVENPCVTINGKKICFDE